MVPEPEAAAGSRPSSPPLLLENGDLYALLETPRDTSASELRKAYHRLALRWHPDKNTTTTAAARFHSLQAAFEILGHPVRRQIYDSARFVSLHDLRKNPMYDRADFDPRWAMGAGLPPDASTTTWNDVNARPHTPRNWPPANSGNGNGNGNNTNDHGSAASPNGTDVGDEKAHVGPEPGMAAANGNGDRDVAADGARILRVPLEQLYCGFEERLTVVRRVETAPGEWAEETVLLTVEGAPGWVAGTRVTFAGAGDQPLDALPGNVVVVVEEAPHAVFRREGDDLHCQVRVPLLGALFGCTTDVPTLLGESVHVAVDGARPGQVLRLRGHGMRRLGTPPHVARIAGCGDLVITFQVAMPAHAAEHVWPEDPSRPTNWLELELQCQVCGGRGRGGVVKK